MVIIINSIIFFQVVDCLENFAVPVTAFQIVTCLYKVCHDLY